MIIKKLRDLKQLRSQVKGKLFAGKKLENLIVVYELYKYGNRENMQIMRIAIWSPMKKSELFIKLRRASLKALAVETTRNQNGQGTHRKKWQILQKFKRELF